MRGRVSWDYFMKRRNISYASLIGMEYDSYAAWCHTRYVIPLDEEDYIKNLEPFKQDKSPAETSVKSESKISVDLKTVSKKKKSEIIAICESLDIETKGNETKRQLISLLANVNNSE